MLMGPQLKRPFAGVTIPTKHGPCRGILNGVVSIKYGRAVVRAALSIRLTRLKPRGPPRLVTFLLSIIIFSVFFLPTFAFVVELRFVDRHVYIIIKRIYTQ